MPPKIIKLGKRDDIASVVKQIKDLRERDIVFELEAGSVLLRSSDNLKLMKRTGEVLGKKIQVTTDDEIGRVLAKKAGVLLGDVQVKMPKTSVRVARSDVKPRFSDIMGPKKAVDKVVAHAQKVFETATVLPKLPSMKLPGISKIIIAVLAIVVVTFFALAVFLPKAQVTIFARSEPISRDLELNVDSSVTAPDSDKLVIPGVPVTKEVSQTKSFPATGSNTTGTKATGSVQIYNLTKNTLTLKAATTTLVAGDKKFVFTKDVTGIKATGTTPSATVSIIAEAGGESYNLPANTKFQIVNAALGNREVYAMNAQPITGGVTTPGTVLSQQDLDNAVSSLTDTIISQAQSDLTQEKAVAMLVVPSGVQKEILAHTANKNVGAETNTFDMTVIAKVTGLAFSEPDVTKVVETKIDAVLSADKYLLDSAKKQVVAAFKSIDLAKGQGVLTVHFETTAAYKVDSSNLAKILGGKTESEIREILLSKPEIDNVTVKFWPAWFVHKAPRFNGKVYINTVLAGS